MVRRHFGDPGSARGEELSLRFVNTVAWRNAAVPEERLGDAEALLDWLAGAAVADADAVARLKSRWRKRPGEANSAYRQALELREAIYLLFRARMLKSSPAPEALQALNAALANGKPRLAVGAAGSPSKAGSSSALAPSLAARASFAARSWRLLPLRATPSDMLAVIAWSAADLLTGPRAEHVRQCEDDRGCGWLFLDRSRLNNRRWCSMGDCGNRAKARRHYLRRKERASPS